MASDASKAAAYRAWHCGERPADVLSDVDETLQRGEIAESGSIVQGKHLHGPLTGSLGQIGRFQQRAISPR